MRSRMVGISKWTTVLAEQTGMLSDELREGVLSRLLTLHDGCDEPFIGAPMHPLRSAPVFT